MSGIRLSTPLGDVQVTARCDGHSPATVMVRADGAPPIRRMPEGMRIEGGTLILIEAGISAGATLVVTMALQSSRPLPAAEPNTGEHLECGVISAEGLHLALAARDQDWMAARQPGATGYQVTMTSAGLDLEIGPQTSGARFSVPLALAWASGPDPLSVWYGADAILPI